MTSAPASLQQRHDVVAAASAALVGYGALAYQIAPADLGSKLGDLAEAQARIGAAMVELITAAETAGVIEVSQFASTRAWVTDTAWHAAAQAGTLAAAARILHHPDLKPLADALIATEFTPAVAVVISQEYAKTINALQCGSEDTVLNLFIDAGAEYGPAQVRQLRETVIAQYAPTAASNNSRTGADVRSTCQRGGGPRTGCSSTNSPSTPKDAPSWKRRSLAWPHPDQGRTVKATSARWGGAAAKPWSRRCGAAWPSRAVVNQRAAKRP